MKKGGGFSALLDKNTVKNVERRRKRRKLAAIAAIAAVLAALAGVLLMLLLSENHRKQPSQAVDTQAPASVTAAPTQNAASFITQTPEGSDRVTDAPHTSAPSSEPPAGETSEPLESERPADEPIRISDENSLVLFTMNVSKRFDSTGNIYGLITGQCAISFVNNTDRALYTASFRLGADKVDSVTLDGISARYSFSEDGLLEIPFVNELKMGESCEVFFEFTARVRAEESFSPLVFGYDTAYSLTAYIESGVKLNITGCKASEKTQGKSCFYTVNDRTVHAIGIAIVY